MGIRPRARGGGVRQPLGRCAAEGARGAGAPAGSQPDGRVRSVRGRVRRHRRVQAHAEQVA
eukprot:9490679-Pyramimonas_sp.AAC.1